MATIFGPPFGVPTARMGIVNGFLRIAAAAETGAEPIFKLSVAIEVQIVMRHAGPGGGGWTRAGEGRSDDEGGWHWHWHGT